jgi:hypothetical protein
MSDPRSAALEAARFRKKPVEIEAIQFDGSKASYLAIEQWAGHKAIMLGEDWNVEIATLEGTMTARPGDWIIKGVKGEFYPCKPDIFIATYEAAALVPEPSPPASKGYKIAGQPVTDAVGEEFGRLIAERDAMRMAALEGDKEIGAGMLLPEPSPPGHRRFPRWLL